MIEVIVVRIDDLEDVLAHRVVLDRARLYHRL